MKLLSSLQRTLSLHFLLVAVLPALLFGVVTIGLLHNHLRDTIYERNQLLAEDIAVATDQFLGRVERDLTRVARILTDGDIVQPQAIDAFLEQMTLNSERFEAIIRLDARNRIVNLAVGSHSNGQKEDYRFVDLSHLDMVRQNRPIDRPVWSDVFTSMVSGQPSVTLVLPLADGLLLGNVNLQTLVQLMGNLTSGEADNSAVIDRDGTLVATSDPNFRAQLGSYGLHLAVERALQGRRQTLVEQHDQQQLLESSALIKRTGWVSWVGVDLDAKMLPVVYTRNLLVGILLMAILLAASIALINARRLLQPLSVLSRRAGQIAAGRYADELPSSGFREIDRLTISLQAMSQAIKEREQSLINSEERFRSLVNSIEGTVWEMDVATGQYLFVSEHSLDMFGYRPQQWLDDPGLWPLHVHPDDLARLGIRERRELARKELHDIEYRVLTASGELIWVRDLVTVATVEGQPLRLLGVMVSIADRKRNDAELERYRAHLEDLVAQRTRELETTQHELVQKERLAVLGQLTATVSHEIRNPLGTVANALYLLRETLGSDCLARIERPLTLAERSIQRCDGIISELFDFTRQQELQKVALLLDLWLAEMLEEMVWPDNVRCHWQLDSGASVLADPERLRRALVNVIANALQAMEEKGPGEHRLEVSTRRLAQRCEIVVSDTGGGIPEQIRERIYEPLFSTKTFGVGLGVPIIRNIMTDHGGGVDYWSKVGEGTTVTLWLPLEHADPAAA